MYEKSELENLINVQKMSYEKIGKLYGVSGASIKKAAKKLGIVLPNRRKINNKETFNRGKKFKEPRYCKYCGKEIPKEKYNQFCDSDCYQNYMKEKRVKDWKKNPDKYRKEDMPEFIRRYMLEKNNYKCQICGWGEINETTGNIPLEIHHIDGDCTNNKEENLQVLCPNHHSLTANHGSLNRGNSKRYKLKEYKGKLKQ